MSDVQTEDLTPGLLNIQVTQGDDYSRTRTIKDSAGSLLAISDAKMQIRTRSGTLLKTLSVGSGITIVSTGVLLLSVSKTDTATWDATVYEYDMQVVFTASGKERTLLKGLFIIQAQKTT